MRGRLRGRESEGDREGRRIRGGRGADRRKEGEGGMEKKTKLCVFKNVGVEPWRIKIKVDQTRRKSGICIDPSGAGWLKKLHLGHLS